MEAAYYNKYKRLARAYGTASRSDYQTSWYDNRSYLGGVCVVNLMDFNGDGIEDLFVAYSNGQMHETTYDSHYLEISEFPIAEAYEIEVWTYMDGRLVQLLHETRVSFADNYI